LDVPQHLERARDAERVTTRVRDGDEVDAVQLAKHPGVVAAHGAEADEAGAQRGHQDPAPATVTTASTMRARSASVSDGCTGSETTSAAARSVSGSTRSGAKCSRLARRWFGIG